ncbi:unannotated protein [freshwater metagenome]|uniref:Unannotated protein n=1 Tax=freshwater metagenome TaxID=449393 RepID=A0A6J7DSE1_9ZZZZ|nr:hypothetical protein [Actinomycetota bacterium]
MTAQAPLAAVVLDALAGAPDPGLDRAVGAGTAQRLRAELRAIARRWVAAVAPGMAFEATSIAAAIAALSGHRGPVVLVAPDIPRLGSFHADVLREDLAAGIGVVMGPSHDGLPYLAAFAETETQAIELAGAGWDEMTAYALERDVEAAMLRAERRLVSAADARALAHDPLTPAGLAAELRLLREDTDAGRRAPMSPGIG